MRNSIRSAQHRIRSVAGPRGEAGQGLAEYALILALVAVLCAGALSALQVGIGGALNTAATMF